MFMPFMNWNETLSVNIESIDEQHKKIIGMINELHDYVKQGSNRECMDGALVRLSVYTVKHFIYEESLFKKHGYTFQNEHKKEHDELAERVTDLHKKHTIQREAIGEDLLKFFKDMMCEHITTYDQQYIDFFCDHGVK
jgi:hemerythrin-like metal-binding protein